MTDKKEMDINNEELSLVEEEVEVEETVEETVEEAVEEKSEEDSSVDKETVKEEIISEFSPAPIKIPKYNKEREKLRAQKANGKKRKSRSKKAKRRKRIIRKIIAVSRTILFSVLLAVVTTTVLASLMIKMNTTEYSIESAIRKSNPEAYVVGKIQYPEKINLKLSASNASLADILRDNSLILVTYGDIKTAVDKSSYPSFVAKVAHDVVNYYVYGDSVNKIKKEDISKVLYDNVSYIKHATGIELGESACNEIASYISKSGVLNDVSVENLVAQPIAKQTRYTSVIFSTNVLIFLIVALIALLILTGVYCKGIWHKIIGGAIVFAGAITGVLGFFFRPAFAAGNSFVKCVVSAVVKSFNNSALIFAAITVVVGILVLLIGKIVNEDEDDEYEDEYEYQIFEENV